jgi:alanyl-tRNA synthetase
LASNDGRELWRATPQATSGRRVAIRTVLAFTDEVRALALSFAAGESACFLAIAQNPPGILLATSADSLHAGNVLKAALTKHGGRGGGNAALAQGSGTAEALDKVRAEVEKQLE